MGVEIPSGSTASIALDSSVSIYEDYEVNSYTASISALTGIISSINATSKFKLIIRTIIVKENLISTFRSFTSNGTYTITATLTNALNPQTSMSVSKVVTVAQGITNLTITSPPMCEKSVPCTLSSNVATGSQITYDWNFVDANVTTTSNSFQYTFLTFVTRLQYLVASNPPICVASRRVYSQLITISEKITGLTFCSGTFCSKGISASAIGKQADFVFNLKTGRDYSCLINFGDAQTLTVDNTTVFNGSLVSYNYSQTEAVYTVSITCSNYLNSNSYTIQHYVQYEVTNVHLITRGALKNSPYYVQFGLDSGTNATLTFIFNSVLDNGITYSEATKVGKSSLRNAEPSAIYPVRINAWNYVSNVTLDDVFQISAPIVNPSLLIRPVHASSSNIYLFENTIDFIIDMTMGSNVLIVLYFGEELILNSWPLNKSIIGDWNNSIMISRKYAYPGDYNVSLYLSNSVSSFNITNLISVMSDVNGLIVELESSPVLYQSSKAAGRAFFVFRYTNNSYAGSHSDVSFSVGDVNNANLGPFWLGMDFTQNISKTPMFYDYKIAGLYNASFNVKNKVSSHTLVLPVLVVPTLDGIVVNILPPNVAMGMTIQLNVYIATGNNITLEWIVDGISLGVLPKMCKYIFIFLNIICAEKILIC